MNALRRPAPGWRRDFLERRSVEIKAHWNATSAGPNEHGSVNTALSIEFPKGLPAGKWLFLRYSANYLQPLCRPVLRIETAKGRTEAFIPAPLFGSSSWLGFISQDTQRLSISSGVAQNADFQIEFAAVLTTSDVIRLAFPIDWKTALHSVLLLCMGRQKIACELLEIILNTTPLSDYNRWRLDNERAFDPEGRDKALVDWQDGPLVCFLVGPALGDRSVLAPATIESLNRQVYLNWAVVLDDSQETYFPPAGLDTRRLIKISSRGPLADRLRKHLPDGTIATPIAAGDVLPAHAAALVVEHMRTNPDQHVVYADEDSFDSNGRFVNPQLKPDWSPAFQASSGYVGRAFYFRISTVSLDLLAAESSLTGSQLIMRLAEVDPPIGHIRRVLLTRASSGPDDRASEKGLPQSSERDVTASIIIPSRDRAQLLESCLNSLDLEGSRDIEVIVVDNGSTQRETKILYEKLRQSGRVTVHSAPGPFNFSDLCNTGAAISRGEVLIFLNNDTIAPGREWHVPLVRWAIRDDVGAVGARLLYPSGQLQHGGIVIGMSGYAGHADIGAPDDHPGYLQRLRSPHEVSAVTGACLAVQRSKFAAVGRFDGQVFPVEFSDIDLCLRLREAGWKAMVVPEVKLIHHESATRGRSRAAFWDTRYRAAFRSRWWRYIQDDPYFHPALSLRSHATMLE